MFTLQRRCDLTHNIFSCSNKNNLTATNNNNNSSFDNRNGPITPDHGAANGAEANGHADLFRTPVSSINVTPMRPDDFVAEVVGLPKVLLNGDQAPPSLAVTNLSAASFTSPGSDMFTSSPNTTPSQIRALPVQERDQVVAVSKVGLLVVSFN